MYAELTPREFNERIKHAPIAYLPLGSLEWHGEHMPLGADGIQAQGFFEYLAGKVGGIVLPMLFLGPDRVKIDENQKEYYGMDICIRPPEDYRFYAMQQLAGSAYWICDDLFEGIMDSIMKQLKRAGFKIVVAHGHGPSTKFFINRISMWNEKYGLQGFACWGSEHDGDGLGIQVDHGGMNETSLVMALRPGLVQMENLPEDLHSWPLAVGGKDPRIHAGRELGEEIIKSQGNRMEGILLNALKQI